MTIESLISPTIVGVVFSVVGWWIRSSIIGRIEGLSERLDKFREEMIKDYPTKKDLHEHTQSLRAGIEKLDRDNHASHSNIWGEINAMRDRVTRVEAAHDNCPGRIVR